jgi:hypothetical protein
MANRVWLMMTAPTTSPRAAVITTVMPSPVSSSQYWMVREAKARVVSTST